MSSLPRFIGATSSALFFVLLVTTALFNHAAATPYSYKQTYVVKPYHSIQKVIDKASPGDRIIVEAGTYNEQLVIKTSGIELIGKPGAKLRPPTPYRKTLCTGLAPNTFIPNAPVTQAGICIHGTGVQFAKGPIVEHRKITSVKEAVRGVSVSGFDISGFNGLSIAILGAQDTIITNNMLAKSDIYGALTVFSRNTRIFQNKVQSVDTLRFIGICMDDRSDVHVIQNTIFGYGIGLCVQTNGADVRDNNVSGGCIGAYVDPGVIGASVKHNYISAPNADCATNGFNGSFGVIINGADKTELKYNTAKGYLIGILISDDTTKNPPAVAEGNQMIENRFFSTGQDYLPFTTGKGNVFKKNVCKTPEDICKAQF